MIDIRALGADPAASAAVNTAAIQAGIALGERLLIPNKTFAVAPGIALANNTVIEGEGPASVLALAATGAPLFSAVGVSGFRLRGFAARGSATVTAPNDYPVIASLGQEFIHVSWCDRFGLADLDLANFAGWTVHLEQSPNQGSGAPKAWLERIFIRDSFVGLMELNYFEYAVLDRILVDRCVYGIYSSSGNCRHTACMATRCQIGCHVDGNSGNPAHGAFVNCAFNHNDTNMRVNDAVLLGEGWTECDFLGSVHPTGFGQIQLLNARGLRINGGSIGSQLVVQAGAGTCKGANLINGALWRTDIAGLPAPSFDYAGGLNIKGCIEPGGMSAFNN